MPLVPFSRLMADAELRGYAVGYFESWNLESLLAVADAAEAARSPVILGFSGIYLPRLDRAAGERLGDYAALGTEVCRRLSVPACLLFNESPAEDWVERAVRLGFGLVMFSDETLGYEEQVERTRRVVRLAHDAHVAVEGEADCLPGVGGGLREAPAGISLTDPLRAQEFVRATGIDALAVNIGQAHLHGRHQVSLALDALPALKEAAGVPLVLHGATSVLPQDIAGAVRRGVRKINVGSALKRAGFEALRSACAAVGADYNPYEVMGSGLADDVLMAGRLAVQRVVEDYMRIFGSAGMAAPAERRE